MALSGCAPIVSAVKRLIVGVLIIAAMVGFALWWYSPRQVILRRTRSLLDTVSIDASSGRAARGLQASGIDGFLAPKLVLDVPDEEATGSWSRYDVEAGFRYVAVRSDFTRFRLDTIESLEITDDHATLRGWIDSEVQIDKKTRLSGRYLTEFGWTKGDDRWRISEVKMDW